MTVSIIIAVKTWAKNLEECVNKCLGLDYPDFEIIILPDGELKDAPRDSRIRVIPTGEVSPGKKRDMALAYARGNILAFIDDDAYPRTDWLKNAVKNFMDQDIAAVGGPAITAEKDNLRQQASGRVFASALVSGGHSRRYIPRKKTRIDDYPSCNLLVRKTIMQQIGGFDTSFWPGEDTLLCLEITRTLGKKIVYDPEVIAWHHRRPLFIPHLKQVASYASHRGYFTKKYPHTSRKFTYYLPSLLLTALSLGLILAFFFPPLRIVYLSGVTLYLFAVFAFSFSGGARLLPMTVSGTILTHLVYGFYFIKGLLSRRLKEE